MGIRKQTDYTLVVSELLQGKTIKEIYNKTDISVSMMSQVVNTLEALQQNPHLIEMVYNFDYPIKNCSNNLKAEKRQELIEVIQQSPDIRLSDLAKRLKISYQTVLKWNKDTPLKEMALNN